MARLELRGVAKEYPGGIAATRGIDLAVEDGELFAIVGPSGSGKSTLLRMIAGLEAPDSGSIWLDGRRIDRFPPRRRDVAMVFQEQVLYPHLDVYENIAFGLRARRLPPGEIEGLVLANASVLGLSDCLRRPPATLSGGQRRRVALGRAMVLRPKLFLFDEPFSGLDAPLRASTRSELVDLRRRLGATMVLVTHDQAEALAVGDRVAVLDRGRIAQVGPPLAIYDRPANRAVARFVGQPTMAFLPCLASRDGQDLQVRIVHLDDVGPWTFPRSTPWASPLFDHASPRVVLGLRPEDVTIGPVVTGRDAGGSSVGTAVVRRLEPLGHETIAELDFGPHTLAARLPSWATIRVGDRPTVTLDFERANFFDAETGERIGPVEAGAGPRVGRPAG